MEKLLKEPKIRKLFAMTFVILFRTEGKELMKNEKKICINFVRPFE